MTARFLSIPHRTAACYSRTGSQPMGSRSHSWRACASRRSALHAPAIAHVWMGDAASNPSVKLALQMVMMAKRLSPVHTGAQYPACLFGKSAHRQVRCDAPPTRSFVSNGAYRTPGDARHHAQQMARLGIAVKYLRHFPNAPR
jgi:hypothetical protein